MNSINSNNQDVGYCYDRSDSSSEHHEEKKRHGIFSKMVGAADKYSDKTIEYAQEQVAKREEEENQPGYVKKHHTILGKAVEAAENFVAKQRGSDCKSSNNYDSRPSPRSGVDSEGYSRYAGNGSDNCRQNNMDGYPSYSSRADDGSGYSGRSGSGLCYSNDASRGNNSSYPNEDDAYGFNKMSLTSNNEPSSTYRSARDDNTGYSRINSDSYERNNAAASSYSSEYRGRSNNDSNSGYPSEYDTYEFNKKSLASVNEPSSTYRLPRASDNDTDGYSRYGRNPRNDSDSYERNNADVSSSYLSGYSDRANDSSYPSEADSYASRTDPNDISPVYRSPRAQDEYNNRRRNNADEFSYSSRVGNDSDYPGRSDYSIGSSRGSYPSDPFSRDGVDSYPRCPDDNDNRNSNYSSYSSGAATRTSGAYNGVASGTYGVPTQAGSSTGADNRRYGGYSSANNNYYN